MEAFVPLGGVEVPGSFDGPPSGFGSFRMRLLLQEGETRELGATPLSHEATPALPKVSV